MLSFYWQNTVDEANKNSDNSERSADTTALTDETKQDDTETQSLSKSAGNDDNEVDLVLSTFNEWISGNTSLPNANSSCNTPSFI